MTNKIISVVKIGQKYLSWDDATYRAVMNRITGKCSATKCSADELGRVLDYMHEQGFPKNTNRHGRRPAVPKSREHTLNKIEALLTDAGRKWNYAEGMARKMFKRDAIQFLMPDELDKLMIALIIDQRRRGR
ncbi:gp16 family protein [Citrobacter braakii]|uniref:gp16 family protein n=1 Tax=Citrobacter braakii TaxID=57706 RepID=UPI003524D7B4